MFKHQIIYEPTHFVISGVEYKSINFEDLEEIIRILLDAAYFTLGHDTINNLINEFKDLEKIYSENNNSFPTPDVSVETFLINIEDHIQFHLHTIKEDDADIEKLFNLSVKIGKIRERMEGQFKLLELGGKGIIL